MYIYIYIYIHIYGCIWLYIHVDLACVVLFVPSRQECSTSPPDVGAFGSNNPIVDYFIGTGLMKMFLQAIASFHVFGEKLDLTCFYKSDPGFLINHRFPC